AGSGDAGEPGAEFGVRAAGRVWLSRQLSGASVIVALMAGQPDAPGRMRIAYLVGRYPAISHTFILREVQALRRLGVEVATVSIHRTPPKELLSAVDREENARTFAVLPPQWSKLLAAHLFAAV